MKKRLVALLLTAAMTIGAFSGCSTPPVKDASTTPTDAPAAAATDAPASTATDAPKADPATSTEEKVLHLGVTTEPPSIDQQLSTDSTSGEIMNAIYEGLIRNHGGKVNPGMAEKWDISTDGLTYTFYLRDAKWSDGKPVTAQDFVYGITRLLDPKTTPPAEYAFQGYYIVGGEAFNNGTGTVDQLGVKAIDEKTLEIKLNVPTSYFLSLLGLGVFFPTRQDIVEANKEGYATDPTKTVYNGPFVLTEWAHEANLTLEKNPIYWNAAEIKLNKVDMPIVIEAKTAISMYEEGTLDYSGLGKDFVDKYKAEGKAQYFYDGAVMYYEINQKSKDPVKAKLLQNKSFRQALSFAIDRKAYIDTVLKNNSDPATRYNFAQMAGAAPGKTFAEEHPITFNPETADKAKAQELLAKAATELGMTVDQIPPIEYLTDDSEDVRIQAEAIQSMMKDVGIKFDIKQVPFKERLQLMKDFDYDIVAALWGPDYNDVMTNLDIWTTTSAMNNAAWSNKDFDDNIAKAKVEADPVKRGDYLAQAETILLEDAVIIPVFFRKRAYTLQPYVKDMELNFIGATRDFVFADIVK